MKVFVVTYSKGIWEVCSNEKIAEEQKQQAINAGEEKVVVETWKVLN